MIQDWRHCAGHGAATRIEARSALHATGQGFTAHSIVMGGVDDVISALNHIP